MLQNKISFPLLAALIIIFTIIGIGIGYWFTPEYQLSMYDKNTMDLGTADRWFDQRYLNAMISHHRGAMLIAEQAVNKTQKPELKSLAQDILTNEPKAIAELYQWKKDWYGDGRQVQDPQPVKLGNYDDKFDLRFLNALISHHQSGILMAQEARLKTNRSEILNNIDAVENFLNNGVKMLSDWRKSWYQI